MNISFTDSDIRNSVDYRWRKRQLQVYVFASLFSEFLIFLLTLFRISQVDDAGSLIRSVAIIEGLFLLFWAWPIGFSILKMILVKKNKNVFPCYKVKLKDFSTSFVYKNCLYYTVQIEVDGVLKSVDTHPYFSNGLTSLFTPNEYHDKTVIGLYDEKNSRFLILKIADE